MARSSSSSRFVSVNLSKSYGQPPSPSPGHGGSISVASGSSPAAYRTRVQSGNNGMVVLSRPGRSQPSTSSSTSRTSKLAVPSPVNLPSRRREHAGNDPTVALVGASGSSGWSKQQVSTMAGDSVMAGQSVAAESAAVRSTSMVPDSSWSTPASQGRVAEQQDSFYQAGTSFYQAPVGKSTLYTPPSSRNATAFNTVHAQPSEKVMVVRGEDFPTLQAAARPFVVPTLHRQKDMQQKQQDKQHEGKDQNAKLQELSQQQNSKAEDVQARRYAGPQLQPVRPPEISKQPGSREGQSHEMRQASEKRVSNSYGGPSPLRRLNHTSNWADDERETLQSVHQTAWKQPDRLEAARPRNGYHLPDSRVLDYKGPIDSGHPMSKTGYGRDLNDSRDHEKDAGFGLGGRSTHDTGPRNGLAKSFSNKQFDVDSWEDIANWSRWPGRNDPLKRGWSFPAKEINYDRDGRLGSSGRSFNTKNAGFDREINTNVRKDADLPYRGDNFGSTVSTREVHSRDASSKPNMYFSKHGVNDRLGGDRSRKSIGNYHLGNGNLGRAQSDLSGLDYGREKRVSSLYGQDPFLEKPSSSKPSSSLVLEAFIGTPGLVAKMSRRKKDESQNFHDPARELFEAELERVQRMQEQERQRLAEERERAIELARKEEEERERLAKEEELLRLKMEEEARETAAQAQRKAEEAVRKVEEVRLAREEEKRMVVLEEGRRKEAAKKKLLDLEQRMAQREVLQYQRSYSGTEVSVGSAERSSRQKEEENRALPSFNKFASNEERALGIDSARPMPLESTARLPADTRGEGVSGDRSRVVQMKRRETLDDGLGLPLTVKKYHLRDDLPWSENEREYRGFSMRESSLGPNRSFPLGASRSSTLAHGQANTDPFARNKSWQSGHSDRFSGGQFPTDINAGYMDPAIERDNDGWWARDERRRFQEGQRLNSPPLPFHTNGGENDYPLFGRLRQSLPKQPRVPPPVFGRPTFHRQVSQSETMPAVSFPHPSDVSEGQGKGGSNVNGEEVFSGKKADYVDKILIEAPAEGKSGLAVPIEDFVPPQYTMKVSGETEKAGLTSESQTCKDEMLQPDEIDELSEQLSDLTESEERLGEDEKQLMVDAQLARTVEPADDEDGWLVQARAEDMDEEMCVNKFENEVAVEDASDEQEWDSSRVLEDVTTNVEQHGTEKEEVDEATWENQLVEDEGDGVVDDPEKAAETQWESNEVFAQKIEKQDDTELKDLGIQDAVKDHVVQLQNVLSSANTFDFARVGQSESYTHGQSFLQHFQQPFSFMAVPLSQSTALNGVASHPPMLPSMHSVQAHQEVPYHLQMGLLSGTPLMPNAIQIGSIQMPLQVHPQMPPVGHLHHQQPPVFQFGQLCPFSQPLPPMQQAVQMHHAMGQPPSAQHYQAEFFYPVEGSHLSKVDEVGQKPEEMAMQSPYGLRSGLKSSLENPGNSLGGCRSSAEHIDCSSASCSITLSQNHLPSVEGDHDAAALQGVDASIETNQDTSVGKILSGRRRNSSVRSSGIYGRGRGRSHTGKNHDHEHPYSVSESRPENTVSEEVRSRIYRQTFRRAEYKVRKSLQTSGRDADFSVDCENHSSSYVKDIKASDGLRNAQMPSTEDTSEMTHYIYSQSLEGSNSQHAEALARLQSPQVGFGCVQADVTLTGLIRSANTLTTSTEGNGFNSDDLGDTPLQSGVDFVYEEQASEVQNEKDDDFIEVRSKRHLLREQRELRDKAKSRELKVKEQAARKQQKVVGKPVLHEQAAINYGRAVKQPPAVIGSGLQQFRATPTSIGLPAAASSDPKVSKSGQYEPVAVATHPDSGKGLAFEHRYFNDALDTTTTINTAWGVQRSSHEVVSLTQIQLEETMKPFCFDGISSQLAPIAGGGPTVLEQGILPSSGSLEKVSAPGKASVSMPGPISSLLAGEKIQFGAVTSPTVISSPSHPPSPSFVGAIGSQLGADMANISSHPVSHTRNYFGQDTSGGFLSSKMFTRAEDDVSRQLADSEAEAEAAASAIAVAAISNEEAVGNHSDASLALGSGAPGGTFASFPKSSGFDGTGAGIIQAPSKCLGVDDSMSVALPADLSLQASLPSHPVSSDIMMQPLPSRASPFPCLEMGTILGGPIFAYGPRDDAPLSSLEPGFAGVGAGNIAGWQHRFSNTSDSFYGAPPPFMSPAGLPSIQGHPHMLVYTNPFAPVGQFGQLGVSFMGSAYHPSGKQPDWTHTSYTTSPGSLNQSGVDMNAGLPVMMDPQHSGVASNSAQAISVAGCSMMHVPAPMSLFDPNFTSPFQAPWSRGPSSPFSSYHVAGPAPGLNLQSRASVVPGELGRFAQSMHMSDNSHQLPETSDLRMTGDMRMSGDGGGGGVPGVNFPDALGFGYPVLASNTGLNNVEILSNRDFCAGLADLPGSNLQQGQSIPQNVHGNLNLAPVSSRNEAYLGTHDARGNQLEASHAQTSDLEQQGSLGHLPSASHVMEKRPPQQAQARGSSVADYQRRGSSRTISTVSAGERGPASSPKPKQIYVAKPAAPVGST